jgi:hypothetical protein
MRNGPLRELIEAPTSPHGDRVGLHERSGRHNPGSDSVRDGAAKRTSPKRSWNKPTVLKRLEILPPMTPEFDPCIECWGLNELDRLSKMRRKPSGDLGIGRPVRTAKRERAPRSNPQLPKGEQNEA